MFNDETTLFKKRQYNVITTKKKSTSFFKSFFLRNNKSIIYKKKKRDWNMEIFDSFFKDMKNRGNIKCRENRRKSRFLTYIYISIIGFSY